jgi:hypothetical protein
LDFSFHFQLQKVEVRLRGWILETRGFDKNVLILIEKVNKNYSLLLKRVYEGRILENHEYRKECFTDLTVSVRSNPDLHPGSGRPRLRFETHFGARHGLWRWMAGMCPLDKGHTMERHFLAGRLRRKA